MGRNERRAAAVAVVVLLAAVMLLAACGARSGASRGSSTRPAPKTSGSPSSPSPGGHPAFLPSPVAILRAELAHLDRLVVRRSDAFPSNRISFSFPSLVTVSDASDVRAVARALLSLPLMPQGMFCPVDLGIRYHLSFLAGDDRVITVSVSATGCEDVNGLGRPLRWVARTPGFWRTLGSAMGLSKPDYATFRGSGPS
jgi:hypothetical protein